jgi:protein-tyrosine phosphatase
VTFHVLFVCTGNVCRSPMAERLFAARLAETGAVTVSSAGTRALTGYGMDAASAAVLRELGGDPTGHLARQLGSDDLAGADLVLAADSSNRGLVVRERPALLHRGFTLREFGRLAAGLEPPPSLAPAVLVRQVAAVAARRGTMPPAEAGADEIGDPFGAAPPLVRACGEQVSAAVDAVLTVLGLAGGGAR